MSCRGRRLFHIWLVSRRRLHACARSPPPCLLVVWPPADTFPWAGHSSGTSQSSNGITLNLSSNNPFRNRAASPASVDALLVNKPASPFDDPPPRPLSRNPFIDQPPPIRSPGDMSSRSDNTKSLSAEEIFVRSIQAPSYLSMS